MKKILITHCKYQLRYSYYITDTGQIWSEKTHQFLSTYDDKNHYKKVRLSCTDLEPGKTHAFSVHRLVLENFNPIPNMENLQVNHIDGNKSNNNLTNLEWVTCQQNSQHAIDHHLRAEINGAAKLTSDEVIKIYNRSHQGELNIALSKEFGVHPDIIGKIKNNKMWTNITNSLQ